MGLSCSGPCRFYMLSVILNKKMPVIEQINVENLNEIKYLMLTKMV